MNNDPKQNNIPLKKKKIPFEHMNLKLLDKSKEKRFKLYNEDDLLWPIDCPLIS